MHLWYILRRSPTCSFFFFNDTATTEIYTLSLHDALPILKLFKTAQSLLTESGRAEGKLRAEAMRSFLSEFRRELLRSEEHTSELQSPCNLVCRLLLEKKKCILSGLSAKPNRFTRTLMRLV